MQHDYLEHQWQGSATQPEWVNDLFDNFDAWHTVGPKALTGEIGVRCKHNEIKYAVHGDWIIANIDGSYNVKTDEQHALS